MRIRPVGERLRGNVRRRHWIDIRRRLVHDIWNPVGPRHVRRSRLFNHALNCCNDPAVFSMR